MKDGTVSIPAEKPIDCEQANVINVDVDRRRITHVISTGRLDRGNRIVDPAGWDLANFKRAPRVLADHDYSIERVIGKAIDTKVVDDRLISTTEFDDEGLGEVAFRLVLRGLVNTWSVGWIGTKSHRIGADDDCERCAELSVTWGTHFLAQELLEYSLVSIPANPDVVMGLRNEGLVSKAAADAWIAFAAAPKKKFARSAEAQAAFCLAANRLRDDMRRRAGLPRWPGELSPHRRAWRGSA